MAPGNPRRVAEVGAEVGAEVACLRAARKFWLPAALKKG